MLDLGSCWYHRDFFPLIGLPCDRCGACSRMTSGLILDEWEKVYASYLAYIPAGGTKVVVYVRFGSVESDNYRMAVYEARLHKKQVFVSPAQGAPGPARELVDQFDDEPNPDEVVDFILRADPYLIPAMRSVDTPEGPSSPRTTHGRETAVPAIPEHAGSLEVPPDEVKADHTGADSGGDPQAPDSAGGADDARAQQ